MKLWEEVNILSALNSLVTIINEFIAHIQFKQILSIVQFLQRGPICPIYALPTGQNKIFNCKTHSSTDHASLIPIVYKKLLIFSTPLIRGQSTHPTRPLVVTFFPESWPGHN